MSVDDLTFVKQIGTGALGGVFLTLKKDENLNYATNIIDKSELEPNAMEYINNGINLLKDLNHPNILKLYEVRETTEKIYIITEYYNGGNLEVFFKEYKRRNYFFILFTNL